MYATTQTKLFVEDPYERGLVEPPLSGAPNPVERNGGSSFIVLERASWTEEDWDIEFSHPYKFWGDSYLVSTQHAETTPSVVSPACEDAVWEPIP